MKEGERGERGEGTRGEGAGVYGPHWLRDLQAPRLCSALIIFGGEDKRKKGGIGRKARDLSVVTGPPTSPPLVGVVWTPKGEGKAAEQSTLDWGFLPQQRDCHKTAFHSSRGLVLLRFQVCIQSMLASLPLTHLPLPAQRYVSCVYSRKMSGCVMIIF